ncbi:hypothetical protein A2U01_0107881, partial [Trifolium medium]|nr:hypothetical protein [Trifolium medium]
RATTRNKISKTGQHCAPHQPQLRVAQTQKKTGLCTKALRVVPALASRRAIILN